MPGDELLDRITELELRVSQLQADLHEQREAHTWLRRRFAMFYPERTHCPKCHRLVAASAIECACGERWGKAPDPKAGLPREPLR